MDAKRRTRAYFSYGPRDYTCDLYPVDDTTVHVVVYGGVVKSTAITGAEKRSTPWLVDTAIDRLGFDIHEISRLHFHEA